MTVVWPKGAFASPTTVTVSATATNATDQDFNSSALLFRPFGKRLYEIRINTGGAAPAAPAHATLTIPHTFLAVVPGGYGIQAFIQFLEEGGDDSIDSFEMVDSVVNLPSSMVDVEIPPAAFVELRDNLYVCSWCEVNGSQLVLLPSAQSGKQSRHVRYPGDADILGRVTAVTMRIAEMRG